MDAHVCSNGKIVNGLSPECPHCPPLFPEPTPQPDPQVLARRAITYRRDENNGAGLNAVFIGDFPVHHFRADRPEKPKMYMEKLEAALAAIIREWMGGK